MKIAFDVTLRRPGCAIVQALYGADVAIIHRFDPNTWLTSPTPDMKVYEVKDEEMLEKLIVIVREAMAASKRTT